MAPALRTRVENGSVRPRRRDPWSTRSGRARRRRRGPDPPREQVGVRRAEERAVRVAGERSAPRRRRPPQQVAGPGRRPQSTCGRGLRDALDTCRGDLRSRLDRCPLLARRAPGRRRACRGSRTPPRSVSKQRRRDAADDAPRVEADQVEPRPHLVESRNGPASADEVDAGPAGAAGVQEQRADPLRGVGRGQPDERQGDLPRAGGRSPAGPRQWHTGNRRRRPPPSAGTWGPRASRVAEAEGAESQTPTLVTSARTSVRMRALREAVTAYTTR